MFAKAEAALETALKLDNKLGEAYTSLGLLRLQQKDLEGAEQSFKRALELYPNYPPLNLWYGMLLEDLGRWDEALARKAAAVKLDPMSAIIRRSYAVSLRGAGRYEEALDELETVLEIDPNFVPALDSIATIQWQVFNQHEKAVQGYVNLITLDPKSSDYYVWLGGLYLDLGEPGRAGQLFDHAIELAPNGTATSWGVLLLQLYRGNYGATVDPARMILTDWGPNQLMGQFSAAQIRNHALAEGRDTEALAIYSETYPQLLTQDKPVVDLNNYRAAIDLALVLGNEGDQKRADLLLESSLAFISTQPRLGLWGGFWVADVQILALQGKNQEAIAALQQAADDGWRSLWWYYLQYDPNLNSIRGEPEFQIVVAEIQADMASKMQRVREMEQSGEIGPVPGVVIEPK
jgi:Tfp pilus assembly protein PilF